MNALLAALKKETLLFLRDWHALALLFIMPMVFIVIMSLALQERFGGSDGLQLNGQLHDLAQSPNSVRFTRELALSSHLKLNSDHGELNQQRDLFALTLEPGFEESLAGENRQAGATLEFAAELGKRERTLISAAVREAFAVLNSTLLAEEMGYDRQYAEQEFLRRGFVATREHSALANIDPTPNAVQQSVPAWLIFAMFFVAVPLSTAVISERHNRTLTRVKTFGATTTLIYAAKLTPYFVINMLQLALMLLLGNQLLPALGAEGLALNVALTPLFIMGICTSFTALALASLIAALASSTEQATVTSATVNILLAAIGGVMIPVFVMPPVMQAVAVWSPMAWALEGFLAVLVRGGSWTAIALPATKLLLFASTLMLLAIALLKRGTQDG
ncbi:ABC transporter permease [Gilvimarinus sp. SDUM040013]|uniref:ABC transporter permease n=1 Tax=Gilvimarinus gilvus TaxID=3058038 RepID=A0ABU4S1M7_9GAMM|nr:ABC transporter permease [Gilvimarinus sp. SDUM040013]MDO3387802.1 ABC transporter permease [Gilvimarinus sp. SDUM040013]MDX6851055.1 ABC transporter permease [Gilvimarinus sp. SDUM040013]